MFPKNVVKQIETLVIAGFNLIERIVKAINKSEKFLPFFEI